MIDVTAAALTAALTTGCAVELVEIRVGAKRFVSVGLEARGAPELLRPALDHAAGLLFAEAPPPGAGFSFSLDNSQSYAECCTRPSQAAPAY